MMLSVTSIITSLLAFSLLRLRGVYGLAGWRWLFLSEGFLTLTIGLASFVNMPPSIVQTKTRFYPRGWFTDREAITPRRLWDALREVDLWPMYAIGLVAFIPQGPVNAYLTLTLRGLGFDPFTTNLLTIPSVCWKAHLRAKCNSRTNLFSFQTVFHIINLLLITHLSERLNQRALVAVWQNLWTLPCIFALHLLSCQLSPVC
jgi:hypothetical protein